MTNTKSSTEASICLVKQQASICLVKQGEARQRPTVALALSDLNASFRL